MKMLKKLMRILVTPLTPYIYKARHYANSFADLNLSWMLSGARMQMMVKLLTGACVVVGG